MDLTTAVIVFIPRRMFTEWLQFDRKFMCFGDFQAGSVFNGAENFGRLLVLYSPPYRCVLPHHDPKKLMRLQDEPSAEQQLRAMQAAVPEDRRASYLRVVEDILASIAELPAGSSNRTFKATVASACAKITKQEADAGKIREGMRRDG